MTSVPDGHRANYRPGFEAADLGLELAADTEVHFNVGGLEVVDDILAPKGRQPLESEQFAGGRGLPGPDQIANELNVEELGNEIPLREQVIERDCGCRDWNQAYRTDIEQLDFATTWVLHNGVSDDRNQHREHACAEEPRPI